MSQAATSQVFGCVGSTIRTVSGIYFDYLNPTVDMIRFEDIAFGLANECRFARQSKIFYSVAEHSMECAHLAWIKGLRFETVQSVFAHDFHEAYTGDIPKPLKILLGPALKEIEQRIDRLIEERFGVDLSDPLIKQIDQTILISERNCILYQRCYWS